MKSTRERVTEQLGGDRARFQRAGWGRGARVQLLWPGVGHDEAEGLRLGGHHEHVRAGVGLPEGLPWGD